MWLKNLITKIQIVMSIYRQLSDKSHDAKKKKSMEINKIKIEHEFIQLICECSGITMNELMDVNNFKKRKPELVISRQLHMSLKNLALRESLIKSGKTYGKNHATVIHGSNTIRNLVETDKRFREQYRPLFEKALHVDHTLSERLNLKYLYK